MSSRTKKPIIDPKSKEAMENLETTFDLFRELADYERMVKEENERRKKRFAREVDAMGQSYVDEIEKKWERQDKEKMEFVTIILKSAGKKYGDSDTLFNLPYEDVKSIYEKVLDSQKPWYKKLIEFFIS